MRKEEKTRLDEKLSEISGKRVAVSASLREKEKFARGKEEVMENLRNRIRNHEIKNREKEFKIVNITDRVREAYKTDIAQANIEIPQGVNWKNWER